MYDAWLFTQRTHPDEQLSAHLYAYDALNNNNAVASSTLMDAGFLDENTPLLSDYEEYNATEIDAEILLKNEEEQEDDAYKIDNTEEAPIALTLSDEIWMLAITQFFDLETLQNFILVCRRFYAIGNDATAIGNVYINEVMHRVRQGHVSEALIRNWQGIFKTLWAFKLISPEKAAHLWQLLANTRVTLEHLPIAISFLNDEIIHIDTAAPNPQRLLQRLWIQGTLLFGNEAEPNGVFLRELTGVCHTLTGDIVTHITVQRLFAMLDAFHYPANVHIAALNALRILFAKNLLSDKEMESTLTVMLHIITGKEYPKITRLASAQCMKRLLLSNALTDLRRGCVFKAVIHDITRQPIGSQHSIELIQLLDIETLSPILSPRLRTQLIQCLPTFMRSPCIYEIARRYIVQLLHTNAMTLEEEAQLSNNLQALITDPDAYIRARILPLLAEGILHSNLSISFRNACALAFRGLLEDESEVVAEGLFEQCIRIYESNTDSLALTLFYDGAVQLASTRSSVRAQVAMALLNRFHEERGVEGLLTMDPHERQR